MAFANAYLHLRPGAPGNLCYVYDATSGSGDDTMAEVAAAGYFNNSDDDLNLVAGDTIYAKCSDGYIELRVASISSGSVTTVVSGALSQGFYEIGTSIATATRAVLPTPVVGMEVTLVKVDSGSQVFTFDAGGSGATGVTFDSVGNRRISMNAEGEMVHLVASSTTRWRIKAMNFEASAAGEGGSRFLAGT
jgi:hypothetical protein